MNIQGCSEYVAGLRFLGIISVSDELGVGGPESLEWVHFGIQLPLIFEFNDALPFFLFFLPSPFAFKHVARHSVCLDNGLLNFLDLDFPVKDSYMDVLPTRAQVSCKCTALVDEGLHLVI